MTVISGRMDRRNREKERRQFNNINAYKKIGIFTKVTDYIGCVADRLYYVVHLLGSEMPSVQLIIIIIIMEVHRERRRRQ